MNRKINKNRLAYLASLDLENFPIQKVIDIWIKYETGLHECISRHGKQYTLGLYKDCYAFLRNYLLELPTQPVRFCKVDRFGIPKPLWPLRPLIKRGRIHKRVALSIARGFEVIRLEIDYSNLASITDPLSEETHKTVRSLNKKFRKSRLRPRLDHSMVRETSCGEYKQNIIAYRKDWLFSRTRR